MSIAERLDGWGRGVRAPLLAALLALIAGLPGVLAVPPIDRDESRFAEASAQMLETGDFTTIRFQDQPRFKKPVGIYWLQAVAVAVASHVEDRRIWPYRLPSLAGAMLAAGACAWGAGAFLRPGLALLAGALMGGGFLLSTEAGIAATDAALCGVTTLMMAALARLYLAARAGSRPSRLGQALHKTLMWVALALSLLLKGPIGPMVFALTLLALAVLDRRSRWIAELGWGWGLIGVAAITLPWAMAITVTTDGAFWGQAVSGDLAPKLAGGQEGHAAPFGLHAALAPLLLFPASLLLPGAAAAGWRYRHEPAVRFALCWLVPSWLVFEAAPTKLIHYTLPLFGALIWLAVRALASPLGRLSAGLGGLLAGLTALALAAAGPFAMVSLGAPAAWPWAALTALMFTAAGAYGAVEIWRGGALMGVLGALALAIAAHGVMAAGLVPALRPLWLSERIARRLAADRADPRQGVIPGPVTVAGYAEPSLVFLLGTDTVLGDGAAAAQALAEGRPAIVEQREEPAFRAARKAGAVTAHPAGQVQGLDYSKGRSDILTIYLPSSANAASRSKG